MKIIFLPFHKILSRNILADKMTMLGVKYCIIPLLGRGKALVLFRKLPGEV